MTSRSARDVIARPISEYHEDLGDVLWWRFPIVEPPFIGSPNSLGHEVVVMAKTMNGFSQAITSMNVGGWPGYHTHWTLIAIPSDHERLNRSADDDKRA